MGKIKKRGGQKWSETQILFQGLSLQIYDELSPYCM
jgi:hypothetical protein